MQVYIPHIQREDTYYMGTSAPANERNCYVRQGGHARKNLHGYTTGLQYLMTIQNI